ALKNLSKGTQINFENQTIDVVSDVKAKHKIALTPFETNDKIIMYGVLVGSASKPIGKGEVITTENVKHQSEKVFGKTEQFTWTPPEVSRWKDKEFMGYHRADGQVGTRNVWLFFPLVFCENRNIEVLKEVFEKELLNQNVSKQQLLLRSLLNKSDQNAPAEPAESVPVFDNVEVQFITHQGGCGGIRQDSESLARLLAGYVNNPNVAGATVLSLGCQNLQIRIFKDALTAVAPENTKPVLIYEQQQMGTVDNMLNTIITDSFEAIKKANEIKRSPASISKLRIGLECGGSDGFSGISANPTLGHVSDIMAAVGGSAILS